jgi:hypothetical protein
MASVKRYAVKTRFVFEGYFYINAIDREQAREYAEKHCGLVIGGKIHSTLPDDVVDWDFPVHPEKLIGKATLAKDA